MSTVDLNITLFVQADLRGNLTHPQRSDGLIGRWNYLGTGVLTKIFRRSIGMHTPDGLQNYLRGGVSEAPAVLTLDFVKHAHPFAWARTELPPLMTLDWVHQANPFATNDQEEDKVVLNINAVFNGKPRITNPGLGTIVLSTAALNVQAQLTGVCATSPLMNLYVQMEMPHKPVISKRIPKPCETPTGIPNVTSNLPYDVWQTHSLANFYWNVIYACARDNEIQMVPVDGYYWKLSKDELSVADYTWDFTTGNTTSVNLSTVPPYGTGRWVFHVAAATSTGIGPVGRYIVKYNHQPQVQQPFFMFINGLDSLNASPHVAYKPPTPHILTWSAFSDPDPADVLTYDVEIGKVFDFSVNPFSHEVPVETKLLNLPTPTGILAETLVPGSHYWRIRAYDGNEYSDWSPIGSFRINFPTDKPTELEARSIQPSFDALYVQGFASGNIRKLP